MKVKLSIWLALLLALLGPGSGVDVAEAKEVSAILSGGNLEQPVFIPWHGGIEPAMLSQRRLLFPAEGSNDPGATMEVYDVAYRMEMFSVGPPMRGTYVPRPSAEGGIYVPEGSGVEALYLTTPEFDEVLKPYLVAALVQPGVEVPSLEAARSLVGGISFATAMARTGIGSRVAYLQSLFPRVDSATNDAELDNEQVGRDQPAIDPAMQDRVSPASDAPGAWFSRRLSQVAGGGALGIVAGGTFVGFALHWRKRRRVVEEGSQSAPPL